MQEAATCRETQIPYGGVGQLRDSLAACLVPDRQAVGMFGRRDCQGGPLSRFWRSGCPDVAAAWLPGGLSHFWQLGLLDVRLPRST